MNEEANGHVRFSEPVIGEGDLVKRASQWDRDEWVQTGDGLDIGNEGKEVLKKQF